MEIKKSKQSTDIKNNRIKFFAEAKSHGQLFHATCGSHLTSDNFFKALEMPVWAKKVKQLEDDKKRRLQLEKNEAKGKEVLAMNKLTKQLNATNLEKLLLWHNVPKNEVGNKKVKLEKWAEIKIQTNHHSFFNDGVMRMKINWKNLYWTEWNCTWAAEANKLKKMAAVLQNLNFRELDEIEEKNVGNKSS